MTVLFLIQALQSYYSSENISYNLKPADNKLLLR